MQSSTLDKDICLIKDCPRCINCTLQFLLIIKLLVMFVILPNKEYYPIILVIVLVNQNLNYCILTLGSFSSNFFHGYKYSLTMVDDFSRFLWVILLKNKSEVSSQVKKFHTID